MPARKTLAQQLELAANPEPQDFDPEDFETRDLDLDADSDSSNDESDKDRTGHYVDVGRSKLRDIGIALSEGKYKGSKVNRQEIEEESDDFDVDDDEDQDGDDDDDIENSDEDKKDLSAVHNESTEISKILSNEQKALLDRLNSSKSGDIEKGRAVSAQMKIYEGLLDLRIQSQKILNNTNKLTTQDLNSTTSAELQPLIAEVLNLRAKLAGSSETASKLDLNSLEEFSESLDSELRKQRDVVLNKWSRKVELSSGRNALQSSNFRSLGQSSALQVNTVLNDMPRLVKRTQVDRTGYGVPEDHPWLFDDSDFYRLLLKDLVDRKMADNSSDGQGLKWRAAVHKQKKKVDAKASKDRKLKYTIIEKIQSFDAPRNVFKWSDKQAEDLYSGLLGVKITMDDEENSKEEGMEQEVEIGDFNLFG